MTKCLFLGDLSLASQMDPDFAFVYGCWDEVMLCNLPTLASILFGLCVYQVTNEFVPKYRRALVYCL